MHKQGLVHEKDFVIYAFCLRKLISRVVILQTHWPRNENILHLWAHEYLLYTWRPIVSYKKARSYLRLWPSQRYKNPRAASYTRDFSSPTLNHFHPDRDVIDVSTSRNSLTWFSLINRRAVPPSPRSCNVRAVNRRLQSLTYTCMQEPHNMTEN